MGGDGARHPSGEPGGHGEGDQQAGRAPASPSFGDHRDTSSSGTARPSGTWRRTGRMDPSLGKRPSGPNRIQPGWCSAALAERAAPGTRRRPSGSPAIDCGSWPSSPTIRSVSPAAPTSWTTTTRPCASRLNTAWPACRSRMAVEPPARSNDRSGQGSPRQAPWATRRSPVRPTMSPIAGSAMNRASPLAAFDDPDAAGHLATGLHGEGPTVFAPDEVRDPGRPEAVIGRDRGQDPGRWRRAIQRPSPDTEVRARPPIDANLEDRRAVGREGGGSDDSIGRADGPGARSRDIDERQPRTRAVVAADQDRCRRTAQPRTTRCRAQAPGPRGSRHGRAPVAGRPGRRPAGPGPPGTTCRATPRRRVRRRYTPQAPTGVPGHQASWRR